jgi:putative transposase
LRNTTLVNGDSQGTFTKVEAAIRERIRGMVQELVNEELQEVLGVERHERGVQRRGYRHGHLPVREVATSHGVVPIEIPRARMWTATGTEEYKSAMIPRYVRRSSRIDAALLNCYLAGANTRKVKLALRPLLAGTPMSKSVVSRVVKKIAAQFEAWRSRDLSDGTYAILIMDAMRLPVRLARRVVKVPVLVVLGVKANGERELLDLRVAPSESTDAWSGMVEQLVKRNLSSPVLVQVDGNQGLINSIEKHWPKAQIQRCCHHKYENLKSHCPKHAHAELKRDYHAIVYAENGERAKAAYDSFCRKWDKLVPEVSKSLREAGDQLLTFYRFPKAMWKSLRTTNGIERLNLEFRRRTKTQGSFPTEDSALYLLFGLLASGVIRLRKIDGHRHVDQLVNQEWNLAA